MKLLRWPCMVIGSWSRLRCVEEKRPERDADSMRTRKGDVYGMRTGGMLREMNYEWARGFI